MVKVKVGESIEKALDAARIHGGTVLLEAGDHNVYGTTRLDSSSTKLCGETWAYNLDPNGVFEADRGTKIRMHGNAYPAISVGVEELPAGCTVCDMGIQGDIVGMDTRGSIVWEDISRGAGLYLGGKRVDQAEFSKISFCGCSVAVCIEKDACVDGCRFERLNTDGCGIGFYFSPRAAYYPMFRNCIAADNPSYGFYADLRGKRAHDVEISGCNFVRNCGSNPVGEKNAAVMLLGLSNSVFKDNIVDLPGVFWYYEPDAKENLDKKTEKNPAVGIYAEGDGNLIASNIFKNSSAESIVVKGDGCTVMNNLSDADVVIEGKGNTVSCHVFTKPEAKLVLKGAACDSTEIFGVPESRIVRIK